MPSHATLHRHNLILSRLRRGPASMEEILAYITQHTEADHSAQKPSRRTFQRDKDAILLLYKNDIQYSYAEKKYFLDEEEDPARSGRILEAYGVAQLLNVAEAASGFVFFEKRRPQGTEHFYGLLHAIRNRLMLRYRYESFYKECITPRAVHPYALREFKGRWYLLAQDQKDGRLKTFGLDRIHDLQITKRVFPKPKTFSAEDYFRHAFGITNPQGAEPEDIVLSFEPLQGRYVKSFPLHDSQRMLGEDEEETRIGLRLHISHDLIMELLSYGDAVTVIAPESLAEEVKQRHLTAAGLYAADDQRNISAAEALSRAR